MNHKNAKKLSQNVFLPQKRFAYTQLTYLVSYLDGNVKQKQTQNTTNHSDSTMQWTKNTDFLKSMFLNKLKTKLIGQRNVQKTPIREIL